MVSPHSDINGEAYDRNNSRSLVFASNAKAESVFILPQHLCVRLETLVSFGSVVAKTDLRILSFFIEQLKRKFNKKYMIRKSLNVKDDELELI
jgi:hypothetical protein